MGKRAAPDELPPSRRIDDRISELGDWRGEMLSRLRQVILKADPAGLFNASLEGNVRRAIDVREGEKIDAKALAVLVRAAVALNASRAGSRSR